MRILLVLLLSSLSLAQLPPDIPEGHWAGQAIEELLQEGVITGYPDGLFRGDSPITRYETSVLLSRLLGYVETELMSDVGLSVESLQRELNDIKAFGMTREDETLLLGLIDGLYDDLDLLETRLQEQEKSAPTSIYLFDTLQQNLVQVEEALLRNMLAVQDNTLLELDLRLGEFKAALEDDLKAFVTQEISGLRGDLDRLETTFEDEIGALDKRITDAATTQNETAERTIGSTGTQVSFGVGLANRPYYALTGEIRTPDLYARAAADESGLALYGTYAFSDVFGVEALGVSDLEVYEARINLTLDFLNPIRFSLGIGVADEITAQLYAFHDGESERAVIPGLNLGAGAVYDMTSERQAHTLYAAQGGLDLQWGKAALEFGAKYVWLTAEETYSALTPRLHASYAFTDTLSLGATVQAALLDDRDTLKPDLNISLTYEAFTLSAFLDGDYAFDPTTLPTFESVERETLNDTLLGLGATFTVQF